MNINILNKFLLACIVAAFQTISDAKAQQVPDTNFVYKIMQPAYQMGKGSLVLIDRSHHNFHTREGGFAPFSKLLVQDGYRVLSLDKPILTKKVLMGCNIFVIANALDSVNSEEWALPTPSAFSKNEIENLRGWVKNGGSLFLIADHMPFAGAATELGKAFGFEFLNGFAFTGQRTWPPSTFSVKRGNLPESPIIKGLKSYEKIDSVATFTGSAFKAPKEAIPVLSFRKGDYSLQPDTAWVFNKKTPNQDLTDYCQGAILKYGKGRVALFGEAAMFTAQLANGTIRAGFNSEAAPQNAQFLLNLIHWLDVLKE
jgi:hypothetical protein